MKNKTLFFLVICCTALLGRPGVPSAANRPVKKAKAAIVANLNTGRILYERQADSPVPPASLTKIMTMFLVFDAVEKGRFSYLDRVRISRRADRTGGSSMGAVQGRKITVWDLLKGIAVASGNDACVAVAENFPGGLQAFVRRMNNRARLLHMRSTLFKNPNGLPAKGQMTTARDMLRLSRAYLRRFPQALRLHSMKYTWFEGTKLANRNGLLGKCPGVDGLKTGYTRASGYNIILTAERDGVRLLLVLLGARSPGQRRREALQLINSCFAKAEKTRPRVARRPEIPKTIKVLWNVRDGSTTIRTTAIALPENTLSQKAKKAGRVKIPLSKLVVTHSDG